MTQCAYRLYWDGSANGFEGEVIDGVAIDQRAQLLSSTTVTTWQTLGEGDNQDVGTTQDEQFFLPLMRR
jgi:hypothetical protein